MVTRHRCDNRMCVNPAHLTYGTARQNSGDMVSRDRHTRGTRSGTAKLTDGEVLRIRELYAGGRTQKSLAAEFSVSRASVCLIVNRKHWRHLP